MIILIDNIDSLIHSTIINNLNQITTNYKEEAHHMLKVLNKLLNRIFKSNEDIFFVAVTLVEFSPFSFLACNFNNIRIDNQTKVYFGLDSNELNILITSLFHNAPVSTY